MVGRDSRSSPYPYLACLALFLGAATVGSSQAADSSTALRDSAMVRAVAEGVFEHLRHSLARAAVESTPSPWKVETPRNGDAVWERLREHLLRSLRARAPSPDDTATSFIRITAVRVEGDTLFATFTIGGYWRCRGGGGGGSSTEFDLRAVRYQGWWQPPKTEAVEFGDSAPCPP